MAHNFVIMRLMEPQNCAHCNKEFVPRQRYATRQRFCNHSCAIKAQNIRMGVGSAYDKRINRSTVGAISELIVCVDLLAKGYEVFRAVSPACSCDLAILKDKQLLRVEVKTGYKNVVSGKLLYPKNNLQPHDILAIVVNANNITYFPCLASS
jgi:hypothetical protein